MNTTTHFLTTVKMGGYCAVAIALLSSRLGFREPSSAEYHDAWSQAQIHPILGYDNSAEKPRRSQRLAACVANTDCAFMLCNPRRIVDER